MSKHDGIDLDSILDQALDDFEEIEIAQSAKKVVNVGVRQSAKGVDQAVTDKVMQRGVGNDRLAQIMIDDFNSPVHGDAVQSSMMDLSGNTPGIKTTKDLICRNEEGFHRELKTGYFPSGPDDGNAGADSVDREVAETLKRIAEAQRGMEGFEAGKLEEVGESMMEDMMQQFEELGEKEEYEEVIDGVMKQLLSKDLMYEPTKLICEKFPEWLVNNKKDLSPAEYDNYGKMYQTFQRLLSTYETEPDNCTRLMELLFDMQQYGQPPAEIIKDLAPGLKFDENGMPIMPNMGSGGEGFPDLSNLSSQMASGQCTIN